jgi:L-ascorbate metabolism protein UlaG (beta-lactamase superfamily)
VPEIANPTTIRLRLHTTNTSRKAPAMTYRRFKAFVACGALAACQSPIMEPGDPRVSNSQHFDAKSGVFVNEANPHEKPSKGSWDIWSRFLFGSKEGTVPQDAIPLRKLDRAALDALPDDANHIIRLGHSSHLMKLRGKWWLIDPVFGERTSPFSFAGPKRFHQPPLALADVPPIEALVLSHDHYDHLDVFTIEALKDRVQRYLVPLGVGERLRRFGIDPAKIQEFDWWQDVQVGDVKATAAPAHHFSGRTLWDRNSTLWASWAFTSGNQRIYFSGDSAYFPGFKEIGKKLGPFDIALMENGAYDAYWPSVHMMPEETVQAFRDVGAKTLYLVHNSTFDLAFHPWREPMDRVAAIAEKEGVDLATPVIGEVLTVGAARQNQRWWKDLR